MKNSFLFVYTPAIENIDYYTRIFLELKGVKLAALRRTLDDLIHIENALSDYSAKVIRGDDAVQEDLLFHLAIARASGNSTLNMFMLKITPEIINNFEQHHVCDKDTAFKGIEEHKSILDAIRDQDADAAKEAMKRHFKVLYQYCYEIE